MKLSGSFFVSAAGLLLVSLTVPVATAASPLLKAPVRRPSDEKFTPAGTGVRVVSPASVLYRGRAIDAWSARPRRASAPASVAPVAWNRFLPRAGDTTTVRAAPGAERR